MATLTIPQKQKTIADLCKAYTMALEAVANYLASSVNLEGVRAEEVKHALAQQVRGELEHAQRVAERIKQLGGAVPGASELDLTRSPLDQSANPCDVAAVIRGVLCDERASIAHYQQLIRQVHGYDFVTQDLCVRILAEEEQHRTRFESYLAEYAR